MFSFSFFSAFVTCWTVIWKTVSPMQWLFLRNKSAIAKEKRGHFSNCKDYFQNCPTMVSTSNYKFKQTQTTNIVSASRNLINNQTRFSWRKTISTSLKPNHFSGRPVAVHTLHDITNLWLIFWASLTILLYGLPFACTHAYTEKRRYAEHFFFSFFTFTNDA